MINGFVKVTVSLEGDTHVTNLMHIKKMNMYGKRVRIEIDSK